MLGAFTVPMSTSQLSMMNNNGREDRMQVGLGRGLWGEQMICSEVRSSSTQLYKNPPSHHVIGLAVKRYVNRVLHCSCLSGTRLG